MKGDKSTKVPVILRIERRLEVKKYAYIIMQDWNKKCCKICSDLYECQIHNSSSCTESNKKIAKFGYTFI